MDLSTIKNFVKQNGDKFILVEDGEPEIVVMSFREYERMREQDKEHHGYPATDPARMRHKHGSPWRTAERSAEETEFTPPGDTTLRPSAPARLDEVRLEDLPL